MASDDEEFWKEDAASIADREREQLEIDRTGMRMPTAAAVAVRPPGAVRQLNTRRAERKLTPVSVTLIIIGGLAVGILLAWLFVPPRPVVTLAEFEQLSQGITPDQCNEIVGQKGATVMQMTFPNITTVPQDLHCLQWINHDGTNAVAGFSDGKLYCKVQIGLR